MCGWHILVVCGVFTGQKCQKGQCQVWRGQHVQHTCRTWRTWYKQYTQHTCHTQHNRHGLGRAADTVWLCHAGATVSFAAHRRGAQRHPERHVCHLPGQTSRGVVVAPRKHVHLSVQALLWRAAPCRPGRPDMSAVQAASPKSHNS